MNARVRFSRFFVQFYREIFHFDRDSIVRWTTRRFRWSLILKIAKFRDERSKKRIRKLGIISMTAEKIFQTIVRAHRDKRGREHGWLAGASVASIRRSRELRIPRKRFRKERRTSERSRDRYKHSPRSLKNFLRRVTSFWKYRLTDDSSKILDIFVRRMTLFFKIEETFHTTIRNKERSS